MNKIFKIVFNAARGKMMVVNEATSSVQTGKKAAVTVAVIGALASSGALAATEAFDNGGTEYDNGGYIYVSALESGTIEHDVSTSTLTVSAENGKISSTTTGYVTFSALATDANKNHMGPTVKYVGDENTSVELKTEGSYSMVSRHGAILVGSEDSHLKSVSIESANHLFYVTAKDYNGNQHDLKQKMEIYADTVDLKAGSVDDAAIIGNGGSIKIVADSSLNIVGAISGYNTVYGGVDDMDYDINFSSGAKAVTTIEGEVESSGTSVVKIGLRGDGSSLTGDVLAVGHTDNIKTGGLIELAFGDQGTLNGNVVAKNGGDVIMGFGKESALVGNVAIAVDSSVAVTGDVTIAGRDAANYGGAVYNDGTFNVDGATFEENGVKNDGYAYGGAIYNTASGTVNIEDGSFVANGVESSSKPRGGAIDNAGKVTITNTVFEGNVAKNTTEGSTDAMGGALYNRGSGTYTITDSKFIGNVSSGEGGAISTNGGLVQFKGENEFLNNIAGKNGGAVDVQGGKEVTFEGKNTFVGNQAGANGGAINIFAGGVVTLNGEAIFSENVAAQGNDIFNAGTLVVNGTAQLNSGLVSTGVVQLGEGATLSVGGTTDIATLDGSGATLEVNSASVVIAKNNMTDMTLKASGEVNDAFGGDVEAFAEKIGGQADSVSLAEGAVMGAVTMDAEGNVETQVNTKTEALADKMSLAPHMITRIMMNDVRKRMGDLRAAEGTHGAWARYNGGQMSAQGVDADFHMVQVGIDTVPVTDAPRFGVAFSYAQTEAEDNLGTTDMDSFSLAFYGTKMYDNGMFVDVIGRMATMDSDIVNAGYKGKMDNVALSLSGELGWRFDVTDRFFFEPSVEATYTYTNADKFTMSNGGTYELEATDSLVGRAGFAAGFKCPANKGDVYVRAAVVHEFMGDMTVNSWTANGAAAASLEADGMDTWFEYAIGANFNVNKNTYVYADIERTEGAAMDEDWRANVGVRFAF